MTTTAQSSFSPDRWSPEQLRSIGRLDFIAREIVDGVRQGQHRSARRGFSSEFFDYKSFQPGDDAAKIDWRLYARTGKFFLKRFEAETSLEVMLSVDFSASMRWHWQNHISKLDYAVQLAASLAWLFCLQRDLVGFHSFGDRHQRHLNPKGALTQAERIFASLAAVPGGVPEKEDIPLLQTARALSRILPHKGLLLMISDFELPETDFRQALSFLHGRGDELIFFHLLDRFEIELPFDNATHLRDSETGELLPFHCAEAKRHHAERVAAFRTAVREPVLAAGGVYVPVDTARSPVEAILSMLDARREVC